MPRYRDAKAKAAVQVKKVDVMVADATGGGPSEDGPTGAELFKQYAKHAEQQGRAVHPQVLSAEAQAKWDELDTDGDGR